MKIKKADSSRREFIKQNLLVGSIVTLFSSVTFLTLTGEYLYASALTNGGLVSSPQRRQDYTLKLLKKLCTDLGPRPSGSRAYAKGAKIIMQEMKASLRDVNYDHFQFEKWELTANPEFIVDGQSIEIVPRYGAEGTPPGGIRGILQKSGSGFSVIDEVTGEVKARITASQYGKAITGYQPRMRTPAIHSFGIGKQDVTLLERSARNKAEAWIKAPVRFIPNAKGINIIGRLPGKKVQEIVFVAHSDTVYNTPGANDNTASVIVMLMLAHAVAARGSNHTITFIATDNEEYGMLGANNYARNRLSEGTMKNIRYVINFDSITYGPNLWISSKNDDVKDLLRKIHADLNIKTTPIFDDSDGYVMDSEPFRSSGAKALHANSRGYDEKTLPVYHRPDDTADNVPLDCVEIGFLVFDEFIRRVDKE